MTFVRRGGAKTGLAALFVVALFWSTGILQAACKDTIEPGIPVDASDNDDVDSRHDEAGEAATPDRDAGGEVPRDAARPPPPADAGPADAAGDVRPD